MAAFAGALMVGASALGGPLVPNKTVDISFDGYCDGLHLTINQMTGVVKGNFTGCITSAAAGVVGALAKDGESVAVTSLYNGASTLMYVVDDNPRKWTVLTPDGTTLNSGTYSVGTPVAPQGSDVRPSGAAR